MNTEAYEFETAADVDNLPELVAFVDELLEENDCPAKAQMNIDVALDELFVNIADYAYPEGGGTVKLSAFVTAEFAEITFIDSGVPYNPLEKPDPDVTLGLKERPIGGLGIYLTKKLMDDISYKHSDGNNILTIKKIFNK